MKHLVVLSGAGISAESGIPTFRASDGLWENHPIADVATPDAWQRNPALVLAFYNQRRQKAAQAQPNKAHIRLVELEKYFQVTVITQNVDDLHDRAGSSQILHLHGKLSEVRSTKNKKLVYDIADKAINLGDTCELGSQLRPNIVWFGEAVPSIEQAIEICTTADIFIIIGTSLSVYPAAALINFTPPRIPVFLIDPQPNLAQDKQLNLQIIAEKAITGMDILYPNLIELAKT